MRNNFVIFPRTVADYVRVCRYSRSLENCKHLAFTDEECDKIISLWSDESSLVARTVGDRDKEAADTAKRKATLNWLPYGESTAWVYERLFQIVQDANAARFNFDLSGFFEDLQLTRYEGDGGHYDWHEDAGNGQLSVRKLSMIVQLTEPSEYEGGDLEVLGEGLCERTRGTVFVFPSFVTHKVNPVTKGLRHSLVAWVSGPAFR